MEEDKGRQIEQLSEQKIIKISSFDKLKESFAAKESEKTGGVISVHILRHCQPASNERGAPLNLEGRAEAEKLARAIDQRNPTIIAFGPLPRARETAAILANDISAKEVYLIKDERLNKPSWNLSEERRFSRLVEKLQEKKSPRDVSRLLNMFYDTPGEEAMAEEPAKSLEEFLSNYAELATILSSGSQLNIIAISHQETMIPYLVRRWGLKIFGREEWKTWRQLRGIETGAGFRVLIDMSDDRPKKVLEIAGERFEK